MSLCIFHIKMPILQKHEVEFPFLKGCIKGESEAQKELFDHFSKRMMALAFRYMPNTQEAEDVLIKSFTKVFSSIGSYKGSGSLEGWIRRIVINEALGQLRKEGPSKWAVSIDEMQVEPQTEAEIFNEISTKELLDLISSLPQGYRTVFNLFAVEGYGHKEISEMIGISEGTSKSQYMRARTLLRKKIESLGYLESKSIEYGS